MLVEVIPAAGVALLAILCVCSATRGDDVDNKPNELSGGWDVVDLVVDGTKVPIDKSPDKFWFEIDGNVWHYSFVVDGKRVTAKFFVLRIPDGLPHAVDVKLQNGPFANMLYKGICQLDGDTIKLCLALL